MAGSEKSYHIKSALILLMHGGNMKITTQSLLSSTGHTSNLGRAAGVLRKQIDYTSLQVVWHGGCFFLSEIKLIMLINHF